MLAMPSLYHLDIKLPIPKCYEINNVISSVMKIVISSMNFPNYQLFINCLKWFEPKQKNKKNISNVKVNILG